VLIRLYEARRTPFLPEDLAPLTLCEFDTPVELELPKCPRYRSMSEEPADEEPRFDPELFLALLRAVFLEIDLAAAAALRAWRRLTLPVFEDLAMER